MDFIFGGFKISKIKPNLKMSIQRMHIVKAKKAEQIKRSKKDIAMLLKNGKEEKARIRCEHVVREDFTIEAYEILELLCELILERLKLIEAEEECPFDMREAVSTLVYAATRTEVPELIKVKEQFQKKYGKDFIRNAMKNQDRCVNARVIQKLSAQPPNSWIVLNYMKEIASAFNLSWKPNEDDARFDAPCSAPTGNDVLQGGGSHITQPYAQTDGRITKPGAVPSTFQPVPMAQAVGGIYQNATPAGPSQAFSAPSMPPQQPATQGFDIPSAPTNSLTFDNRNNKGNGGDGGGGGGGMSAGATLPSVPPAPAAPEDLPKAAPSSSNSNNNNGGSGGGGDIPGFDELSARFAALRG